MDVVADTVKMAQFQYGELEDEDIDYYNNGISVFLYDTNGRLLAPKINRGIQVDSVLEDQSIRQITNRGEEWLVYDLYAVQDQTGFWVRGIISMSGIQENMSSMWYLALAAVPVFILIAALGGYFITKQAFQAVADMAKTADAISTGSDLSKRVPKEDSEDELSHLADTINSMLERLSQSFENQKQFTSDVSHELRTPVAVIMSQCEYVLAEERKNAEIKEALDSVYGQARRISSIISQLLLLSRADENRFKPQLEYLCISDLCEIVLMEWQEESNKKGIKLHMEIQPEINIMGDETLLIRMITNLVSNAYQYNKTGGVVSVSLSRAGKWCLLEVADTGIGIPASSINHIWKRFYRVDASRSGEGTGLGLSMVQWITKLHGGEAKVESVCGQGSRFTVKLPLQ